MIYYEEYGGKDKPVVILLHGANFIPSFANQYSLANKYRLILPHITGYGKSADDIYTTEKAVAELSELAVSFGRKVTLVGFSLGAQLAFVLACENPELYNGAVCVSPWIIKEEPLLSKVVKMNEKNFGLLKKEWYIKLCGKITKLNSEEIEQFAKDCMAVKKETILNSINNGIKIEDYPRFAEINFPILALAGAKEYDCVKRSVIKMAEINTKCRYEIWNKAAHNIPSKFADKFTEKLNGFLSDIYS